jgi:hypothetical protein
MDANWRTLLKYVDFPAYLTVGWILVCAGLSLLEPRLSDWQTTYRSCRFGMRIFHPLID